MAARLFTALACVAVLSTAQDCKGDGKDFGGLVGKKFKADEPVQATCPDGSAVVYTFNFSPCSNGVPCQGGNAMMCQDNNCNTPATMIATNANIQWTATSDGAKWVTKTGSSEGCGGPRTGNYIFKCNGGHKMEVTEDPATPCVYDFVIEAECGGSGGMSFGSIMLIILVVVVPIYLVAGFLYNWKAKGVAPGVEALPNIAFWRELPSLVKEGFYFVKGKICKSKGGEQYDEL